MTKKAKVLWIDLEMTGLSPTDDLILEVAAIATDWDFNEIAKYEGVIKHNKLSINHRMNMNAEFWNENPTARQALFDQNTSGKSSTKIESELINFINKYCQDNSKVLLGGNSIHNDRRFIIEKWPKLNKKLHYRMLDVSAWKVVFEGKYGKKFSKPENHRALEDIRGSIMELKYYLNKLK